jgi:HK97 family phage prohead protease
MSKNRENFFLLNRELRVTTGADGSRTIVGTIPYNSPSAGLPWIETISPGAFATALEPDKEVLLLRDHDVSQLFGNTLAKTLVLEDSAQGLNFRCQLPNTTQASDLTELMTRKDIRGVSFGMVVLEDIWADDGKGNLTRRIVSLELYEISVCSFAAFPDAKVALRSLPKALRLLLKRSNADGCDCDCEDCTSGSCDECTMSDCEDAECAENGCPNQDEERSRLNWTERIQLQIEVARRK